MNVIRRQLGSPAMIVACAALIVALGGVSYAAAVLPRNSVGTAQLRKQAVSGAKLKQNAVTTAKVKDSSLLARDFKAGQLPAGAQGLQGPRGPQGLQGPQGPADGPAGGDLTGSYPNPLIADGAVENPQLADNSVKSANVADNSLTGADIGEIGPSEIPDGSLRAADVGKAAGVTAINFASIPAAHCAGWSVFPGVDPDGEAILVTPSEQIDNNGTLAVSAQDSNAPGAFVVNVCNVTGSAIDPPAAYFSWVVFDN